ncbi:hypothetical protein ACIRQP_41225 [Streptomyces sp. NPDC102274]|uniref:hypothetical protein n=1 Tax=Streptomyces sp. NPDC102274 TaxID=3366151 RepID=UPI0038295585
MTGSYTERFTVPNPEQIYGALVETVLEELGNQPVEYREYARGEGVRKRLREVETGLAHYMSELAPGGKFAVGGFVQETAEKTFNSLMTEMAGIDPDSAKDRWVLTHGGRTYREQWETGGGEEMTDDLLRAGIKFAIRRVTQTNSDGEEVQETVGELLIPDDVKERLAIREDQFVQQFRA